MFFGDDLVANRHPHPSAFPQCFGREEGIKDAFLHLLRNAHSIVRDRLG